MDIGRLDRFQRRRPVLGVPIAVIYKFFDDHGNFLAAMVTYYAFIAIFPLLLLASSIFGFVLQGRPELRDAALTSALAQFPIIGEQLGRPEGLTGSVSAVVVGSLAAIYGALGLGQAVQNAMNAAWSVPRNSRPNPVLMRLRSLSLLLLAGTAVLGLSVFSALGSTTEMLVPAASASIRWVIFFGTVVFVALVLTSLFRLAAARAHSWKRALPGAVFTAVAWQALQLGGAFYATRVLAETTALNQTFGLVLGLMGLIFVAALVAILGIEINVVLTRRLWPRALLTPFTDSVDLTDADRRAYALYAQAQRHKGFETVRVRFDGRDGGTYEIDQVSSD